MNRLRRIADAMVLLLGCRLVRVSPKFFVPGTVERPIANLGMFLEDIRARGFRCRGIIDVGANTGGWTRMAMQSFPEADFLLIEPQVEMTACLDALCGEHRNVEYVLAGAGSEEGELVLSVYRDLMGSSFLPKADDSLLGTGKQRKTKIVTLDGLLSKREICPDLVKLDVQGFELEVLKGAATCFGRTEVFILETSLFRFESAAQPMTRELIQFMAERGYELYDITEFYRRPFDGALGQVDLAFVRANGVFRKSNQW
ncbi:MAG: FkbM family methyltransferase [Verrucomicrobia bacterium]|nr:FkbM family methyltransferase [Verrucomicrobiota bacterium]